MAIAFLEIRRLFPRQKSFAKIVITGFNTDIEHGGVIYHVQTEDKGVSTPLILSLVYNRGTILASKRSPYEDLLAPVFDEKALSERLQKQHKLICAAVRAGRIEDLKRMGKDAASSAPKLNKIAPRAEIKPPVETKRDAPPGKIAASQTAEIELEIDAPAPQQTLKETIRADNRPAEIKVGLPKPPTVAAKTESKTETKTEDLILTASVVEEEYIVEAIEIVEDETILAAEAVAVVSDLNETQPLVDDKLKIRLPDDLTFRSGERKTVNIAVYRGAEENVSGGAHIMIKVFGAAFRPLIFHAKTDASGAASVHLQMPQFKGGRAAVLIKAMFDGEETELRRAIVS